MRAQRLVLLAAAPVAAYLLTMTLIAALWVRPPLLGWIGLAVVTAFASLAAAAAVALFPRMRTNLDPVGAPDPRRLLVLADADCPGERLRETVTARLAGSDPEVLVVAPVLAEPLHYLAGDEAREQWEAASRLAVVVAGLRAQGLRAEGRVGDDDPLQALGDALAVFPAGEALVVTSPGGQWLEDGLVERARALVPALEHVEAA
jgi:hypothetical protein